LAADGAILAASSTCKSFSFSTGLGSKLRTEDLCVASSIKFIPIILLTKITHYSGIDIRKYYQIIFWLTLYYIDNQYRRFENNWLTLPTKILRL
jgi:hypothetical protein